MSDHGWGVWAGGTTPWSGGAVALERADDAVAAALRSLLAADDVAWRSPAALQFREVLAEGAAGLQAARARLDHARVAVGRHEAAVRLAATGWSGAA